MVVPAEPDVPQPGFVPQAVDAIAQDAGVEDPPEQSRCESVFITDYFTTSSLSHKTSARCLEALLASSGGTSAAPGIALDYITLATGWTPFKMC